MSAEYTNTDRLRQTTDAGLEAASQRFQSAGAAVCLFAIGDVLSAEQEERGGTCIAESTEAVAGGEGD